MMLLLSILILGGCALAFTRWRWGLFAAVLVGLVQDPLRKMIPDAPGYLAMASLPIWLSALGVGYWTHAYSARMFFARFPRLGRWIMAFAAYLLIPAALSATYGAGTWKITLLGALIYLAGFAAVLAGWRYADTRRAKVHLLAFYALVASLLLVGGPLDSLGWSERFDAIGTEVFGHVWVTHRTGEAVYMLSGFFRGPDVMGWHATAVFMVASILAVVTRGRWRWFWIGIAVWGALNMWLCGRRKMLAMIPVFAGAYLFLAFWLRDARRVAAVAGVALMIGGFGWYGISSMVSDPAMANFYLTTLDEMDDSLRRHAVDSVRETLRQAGWLGYGLGMGQQGIHHIDAEKPRLWQESGPSKLLAEFGLPGMVLLLGVGMVLFRTLWAVLKTIDDDLEFLLSVGLAAMLIANLASSVISAQIFGDPFIALFLAFMTGLVMAGGNREAKLR